MTISNNPGSNSPFPRRNQPTPPSQQTNTQPAQLHEAADSDGIDPSEVGAAVAALSADAIRTASEAAAATLASSTQPNADHASSTEAATPASEVRLAVIVGHNQYQFSKILSGVVCRVDDGKACIDPLYKDISYFFTLTEGDLLAEEDARLEFFSAPSEEVAKNFISTMIKARGEAWSNLYASVGGGQGISAAMVASERANVQRGVERALQSLGAAAYQVPVSFKGAMSSDDRPELTENTGARAFFNRAQVGYDSIQRLADGDGVIIGARLATDEIDQPLREGWAEHTGTFEFEAKGAITVQASSAENAEAVYTMIRQFSNKASVQNVLTPSIHSIENVTLHEAEGSNDFYRDRY